MLKISKQEIVPIPGFTFQDPDTFKVFKASSHPSFEALEMHVERYREQNGLPPIADFRAVWEHYICSNYPEMKGHCCPVDGDISRNFKQYVSGAKVFIKSLFQKEDEKFVSSEEAERRASKCLRCRLNQRNLGHYYGQYYTDKLMAKTVGNRRTSHWEMLYTCAGCSCILNSKVWFSKQTVGQSLMREDIQKMLSATDVDGKKFKCWQLECRDGLNGD